MSVRITGECTVGALLEQAVYEAEARELELEWDEAEGFDLRLLDDEDEGIPDLDLPALNRTIEVRSLGVTSFAMVLKEDAVVMTRKQPAGMTVTVEAPPHTTPILPLEINTRVKDGSGRFIVRVIAKEGTHMLHCSAEMSFRDLLEALNKKAHVTEPMLPQHYRFSTLAEEKMGLDMDALVVSANADQFLLMSKMPDVKAIESFELTRKNTRVNFTAESACAYSEYTVIKTNSRGRKQKRVLGIDETTMYNKPPRSMVASAISAALPSFTTPNFMKRASVESGVKKASRPMASVTAVELIADKEMCFAVTFHDSEKKETTRREFMTETVIECREVVEKIRFLISVHHRRSRATKSPPLLRSTSPSM
jgi:hypothetical protein